MAEEKLILGKRGNDCPYNGLHKNENGEILECQCDECEYLLECVDLFSDINAENREDRNIE